MRTGDLYQSVDAARAAGVPDEHIAEVEAEVVRVTSGPFKGRVYRRTASGLERIDEPAAHRGMVLKNDGKGNPVLMRGEEGGQ